MRDTRSVNSGNFNVQSELLVRTSSTTSMRSDPDNSNRMAKGLSNWGGDTVTNTLGEPKRWHSATMGAVVPARSAFVHATLWPEILHARPTFFKMFRPLAVPASPACNRRISDVRSRSNDGFSSISTKSSTHFLFPVKWALTLDVTR